MGGKPRAKSGYHQRVPRNTPKHIAWALEAARIASGVLGLFEERHPADARPRQAIDAIRAWAEGSRELGMSEVRRLSLDAHAAAREAKSDAACFAARAAGHAVATWHVPTHAMGASIYAQKAIDASKKDA